MPTEVNDPVEFVFTRYGSAEQFRATCKRRGVAARQSLETVLVGRSDVIFVRELARHYRVRAIDGDLLV